MLRPGLALAILLALAACERAAVQLDIASLAPNASGAFPMGPIVGPDAVAMDVSVSGNGLGAALDAGAAPELFIFDCAAPDGPGETVSLYFGGEPVTGLRGSQVSDEREMDALLSAAVPRRAIGPQKCARLAGREGMLSTEIVSRPVPLPSI